MFGPPCEVVFWKVGPSFRGYLVKKLVKEGMKQRDVAKLLGLTEAAISQYLSGKRGLLRFDKEMKRIVEITAKKIMQNPKCTPMVYINGTCEVCLYLRKSGKMCKLHGLKHCRRGL